MFVRETRSLQMNIKLFGLIFTLLTLNISYGCAQEVHTEGKSLNKLKSIFENGKKKSFFVFHSYNLRSDFDL